MGNDPPSTARGNEGAPGPPGAGLLAAEVILAIPFDIDLELDLARVPTVKGEARRRPSLSGRNAPLPVARVAGRRVTLDGALVAEGASEEVWVYGFEIGAITLGLRVPATLSRLADLACDTERFEVDGRPIYDWADARASEIRALLAPAAKRRYPTIYRERDVYPIVVLPPFAEGVDAGAFVARHRAEIVGIAGGEDDWARLSPLALEASEVKNLGYYRDEVVVAQEWGALVSSEREADAIVGLVLFSFAQRWALSSWNHLTNHRQDRALALLGQAETFRQGLLATLTGGRDMARLSRSLFEAHEERLHMEVAIRDFTTVPELMHDWHLHHLYEELSRTFYLAELYKVVQAKNDDLERAYSIVHDHVTGARMMALETWMVILFILEGLLFLVWFLRDVGH